jgi:hypothetical protein
MALSRYFLTHPRVKISYRPTERRLHHGSHDAAFKKENLRSPTFYCTTTTVLQHQMPAWCGGFTTAPTILVHQDCTPRKGGNNCTRYGASPPQPSLPHPPTTTTLAFEQAFSSSISLLSANGLNFLPVLALTLVVSTIWSETRAADLS